MRCQALLLAVISVCVCTLRGGGGVEAFSRIPPYRSFVVKQQQQQQPLLRSSSPPLLLQLASSSTTVSDQDNNNNNAKKPRRYHWLRPTLAIAVPALIGMMADPLLSLMDTAFVGHVGSLELASLGACTSIFHLAFNAFRATTTATTSLVASSLHRNPQEAREVTQLSLTCGVIIGLALLLMLRYGGTWCLDCMGIATSSNLFAPAHSYLTTRAWAAPAVLFIVVSEGAFRGYGNTKIPLLASGVAAIINLILDPVMMFVMNMGVMGAAAATAISQLGAALVYGISMNKMEMLPHHHTHTHTHTHVKVNRRKVVQTILGANMAMMAKQGSLLLAWAYATARATRLGTAYVAAHQVALSFWLVFALLLDGAAVSAQVLMSRACAKKDYHQMRDLSKFFVKFAIWQGLLTTMLIGSASTIVPEIFTSDATIQLYLHQLMPHLAAQQILISLTLVVESLAAGAHEFNLLAFGTTLSTLLAMHRLRQATNVLSIWSNGIVTLFVGRLVTALIGAAKANKVWKRSFVIPDDDEDNNNKDGKNTTTTP